MAGKVLLNMSEFEVDVELVVEVEAKGEIEIEYVKMPLRQGHFQMSS